MRTTCGCSTRASNRPSARKRDSQSGSRDRSDRSSLSATCRCKRWSQARYTEAEPPLPMCSSSLRDPQVSKGRVSSPSSCAPRGPVSETIVSSSATGRTRSRATTRSAPAKLAGLSPLGGASVRARRATSETSRKLWRQRFSRSELASRSRACQSTAFPSETAPLTRSNISSWLRFIADPHVLREAQERPLHRHARRVRRGLALQLGDLVVGAVHLDPRHDELAVRFGQPRQRRFVTGERLAADQGGEGRRRLGQQVFHPGEGAVAGTGAPHLIADLVEDRL